MAGTCDTPQTIDQCRSTMDWLATEIVKPEVCATEIANKNGVVLEALNGELFGERPEVSWLT